MSTFKKVHFPNPDPNNQKEKDLIFALNELVMNLDSVFNKELSGDYLKIDQTTPQTVINGMPTFDEGITANATGDIAIYCNKDFVLKAGQRLVLDG